MLKPSSNPLALGDLPQTILALRQTHPLAPPLLPLNERRMSTRKTPAKTTARKRPSRPMPASGRDPKGGLTAKGRAFFNRKTGSHLKPGVKGPADTPEKMRRKGSFLTRHFTHPRGPMQRDGKPTRLALGAHAWGEPVPKTEAAAKKLAAKGRKLLEKYHRASRSS
jgi:hypothetical protein